MGLHRHARAGERLSAIAGPERSEIWSKGLWLGTFGVLPVLLTGFLVAVAVNGHFFAVDFGHGPWVAGGRLFAGMSPYVGPHSPQLAHGSPFVYPALSAFLLAPLSAAPHMLADAIFTALSMVAVVLTLRVLKVRDWRLYGLVFLWPAVVSGWQTANLTLLIGLGLALAWRYRDRPVVAGALVAVLISVKMFAWPLGLWLLATRRYVAFGYALVLGLAMNLAAWAIIGFDQIGRYVRLMSALTKIQERRGYSVLALALDHGIGRTLAYALMLGLAAAVGAVCVAAGRRGADRAAFALSIATCLLATPIIWLHYFALLVVPLAIARPRLSAVWFAPLVMLFFPASRPRPWEIVATLALAGALTVVAAREPNPARGRRAARPRSAASAQRAPATT